MEIIVVRHHMILPTCVCEIVVDGRRGEKIRER